VCARARVCVCVKSNINCQTYLSYVKTSVYVYTFYAYVNESGVYPLACKPKSTTNIAGLQMYLVFVVVVILGNRAIVNIDLAVPTHETRLKLAHM